MQTMTLQSSVVYGPIESKRFGRSLEINLSPPGRKVCGFDCVYCQYHDSGRRQTGTFLPSAQIQSAVSGGFSAFAKEAGALDWILFSGNGEPTLHPEFGRIVDAVLRLRDEFLPGVPVGALSNASTSFLPNVRKALRRLDGRFMKLDAGNLTLFQKLNRPSSAFVWGDIIYGLSRLKKIVLQSMFIAGEVDNTDDRAVDGWIDVIRYLKPLSVQIYTVDRSPREEGTLPVSRKRLDSIAMKLRTRARVACGVY